MVTLNSRLARRSVNKRRAALLQGGEVRDRLEGQRLAQVGQVVQQRGHAAVVGLEEDLEDQAGEQLRLGELLGAVLVGVGAQGDLGGAEGPRGHGYRRLG